MILTLFVLCALLCMDVVTSFYALSTRLVITKISGKSTCLYCENKDKSNSKKERRIVKYDNVGDPVYEDELGSSQGMNILGINVNLDPVNLTLLIGTLIAFQFFVLANL